MSVINRVLRDLDGQAAAAHLPAGVHSVPAARPRRLPWFVALVPAAAVAGYLAWPRPAAPPVAPVVAVAPAVQARPAAAPVMPTPTAPVAPPPAAAVPAKAAVAPVRPSLAMAPALAASAGLPESARPAGQVVKEARPPTPRELAEAAYAKALRLAEAGRSRDALARAEEALALDPGHVAARQGAVALALENGDPARAEALLREGAAAHPEEAWFARSLAQLYVQRGDHGRAAEALQAGLAAADADYHGLYAGVLAKLGRHGAAAAEYRAALAGHPDRGVWWLGLGLALERAGQRREAAAAYAGAAQTRLAPELSEFVARKRAELN